MAQGTVTFNIQVSERDYIERLIALSIAGIHIDVILLSLYLFGLAKSWNIEKSVYYTHLILEAQDE